MTDDDEGGGGEQRDDMWARAARRTHVRGRLIDCCSSARSRRRPRQYSSSSRSDEDDGGGGDDGDPADAGGVRDVVIPPGALGIYFAATGHGLCVCELTAECALPLRGRRSLTPGDHVIALDGVDVSRLSAVEFSRCMAARAATHTCVLTVVAEDVEKGRQRDAAATAAPTGGVSAAAGLFECGCVATTCALANDADDARDDVGESAIQDFFVCDERDGGAAETVPLAWGSWAAGGAPSEGPGPVGSSTLVDDDTDDALDDDGESAIQDLFEGDETDGGAAETVPLAWGSWAAGGAPSEGPGPVGSSTLVDDDADDALDDDGENAIQDCFVEGDETDGGAAEKVPLAWASWPGPVDSFVLVDDDWSGTASRVLVLEGIPQETRTVDI